MSCCPGCGVRGMWGVGAGSEDDGEERDNKIARVTNLCGKRSRKKRAQSMAIVTKYGLNRHDGRAAGRQGGRAAGHSPLRLVGRSGPTRQCPRSSRRERPAERPTGFSLLTIGIASGTRRTGALSCRKVLRRCNALAFLVRRRQGLLATLGRFDSPQSCGPRVSSSIVVHNSILANSRRSSGLLSRLAASTAQRTAATPLSMRMAPAAVAATSTATTVATATITASATPRLGRMRRERRGRRIRRQHLLRRR